MRKVYNISPKKLIRKKSNSTLIWLLVAIAPLITVGWLVYRHLSPAKVQLIKEHLINLKKPGEDRKDFQEGPFPFVDYFNRPDQDAKTITGFLKGGNCNGTLTFHVV